LLHEKVKWWMGWCNFFAKSKTWLPSWVEKGQKDNLSQAQGWGSFGCHQWPTLCLLWMVQVGKGIKTLIQCLCTMNLLAKSWKWWIIMKLDVNFLWRYWLVLLII
jgi:hypothetical protein